MNTIQTLLPDLNSFVDFMKERSLRFKAAFTSNNIDKLDTKDLNRICRDIVEELFLVDLTKYNCLNF